VEKYGVDQPAVIKINGIPHWEEEEGVWEQIQGLWVLIKIRS